VERQNQAADKGDDRDSNNAIEVLLEECSDCRTGRSYTRSPPFLFLSPFIRSPYQKVTEVFLSNWLFQLFFKKALDPYQGTGFIFKKRKKKN
jgi:hypothetical protein